MLEKYWFSVGCEAPQRRVCFVCIVFESSPIVARLLYVFRSVGLLVHVYSCTKYRTAPKHTAPIIRHPSCALCWPAVRGIAHKSSSSSSSPDQRPLIGHNSAGQRRKRIVLYFVFRACACLAYLKKRKKKNKRGVFAALAGTTNTQMCICVVSRMRVSTL